jgi:hypothetical protein
LIVTDVIFIAASSLSQGRGTAADRNEAAMQGQELLQPPVIKDCISTKSRRPYCILHTIPAEVPAEARPSPAAAL